jgi:very-short-patch-repair endonuclease
VSKGHYPIFVNASRQFVKELPICEHKFHEKRKWRFDFAYIEYKLAVEVEGGVWANGRHTRGSGFVKDMEKYNAATVLGWRILRFTPDQLNKMETYQTIKETINKIKNG